MAGLGASIVQETRLNCVGNLGKILLVVNHEIHIFNEAFVPINSRTRLHRIFIGGEIIGTLADHTVFRASATPGVDEVMLRMATGIRKSSRFRASLSA